MKLLNLFLFVLFVLSVISASGQKNSLGLKEKQREVLVKAASAEKDSGKFDSPELPDILLPEYTEDSVSAKRYYGALTRYFEYRIFGYQHREKVFSWQLLSSKIIFFTVLFLVLIGTYFSYLQFKKAFLEGTKDAIDLKTDLDVSPQGIKLSSPVIGVVILLISLLFFYLYLIYVYPVVDTF